MSHLRCPECRLTVPAAAYYLRGDQCPRCMTSMQPYVRPRPAGGTVRPTSRDLPLVEAPQRGAASPQARG